MDLVTMVTDLCTRRTALGGRPTLIAVVLIQAERGLVMMTS